MGVYQNLVVDNNIATDAEYRAWIQAFEAAMLASGFLEVTPDTGQLDLTTMVRPAPGAYGGYKMYRAKDALAATRPFYVKIEYGLASGTVAGAMIRRTCATGSNGAGTMTGPTSTSTVIVAPSQAGSGVQTILGSGGAHSTWVMCFDAGFSTHMSFWFIGRLLDPADGSTPDPLLIDAFVTSSSNGINNMNYTDGAGVWAPPSNGLATIFPFPADGIHSGGNASTELYFQGLVYRNAKSLVFPALIGKPTEMPYTIPDDSKFSVNIWGGLHTFLPIPLGALSPASNRLAFLWE